METTKQTFTDRINECTKTQSSNAKELCRIREELRNAIEQLMLDYVDSNGDYKLLSLDKSVLVDITDGNRWDETYYEIPQVVESEYVDEIVFNEDEGETMFGITAYTDGEIENCTYNLYQLDAYSLNELYEAVKKQIEQKD